MAGKGKQEIDADGLKVSPGFIDLHTHLDAQIGWDRKVTSVSWHGRHDGALRQLRRHLRAVQGVGSRVSWRA